MKFLRHWASLHSAFESLEGRDLLREFALCVEERQDLIPPGETRSWPAAVRAESAAGIFIETVVAAVIDYEHDRGHGGPLGDRVRAIVELLPQKAKDRIDAWRERLDARRKSGP